MLAWVVRELSSGAIIGTTRYHDIVPALDRVEIGYTWYEETHQRTHVNTTCKLLLLAHAFDTVGCKIVGLRTDNLPSVHVNGRVGPLGELMVTGTKRGRSSRWHRQRK
jgi:RimJ/RimL family protein N-acetyltransferase